MFLVIALWKKRSLWTSKSCCLLIRFLRLSIKIPKRLKWRIQEAIRAAEMNVVQLVSIPLSNLVLLSIVCFDIVSADSIENDGIRYGK